MHFTVDPPVLDGDGELIDASMTGPSTSPGCAATIASARACCASCTRWSATSRSGPAKHLDVGAGVGDFVLLAPSEGFDATGNDLSKRGVDLALERNGLALTTTPLEEFPDEYADAITMWCVLAHVPDPGSFLEPHAHRVLRPGGVLFLRTPGWSAADRYGFGLGPAIRGGGPPAWPTAG